MTWIRDGVETSQWAGYTWFGDPRGQSEGEEGRIKIS